MLKLIFVNIIEVNEEKQEIEMDVIMRTTWIEDRMEFTETPENGRNYAVDQIDATKFWKPEILISGMSDMNSKYGLLDLTFFMVSEGKRVINTFRARVSMSCEFYFELYPLDIQECIIDMMCPFKISSELTMRWWRENNEPPVLFRSGEQLRKRLSRHHAAIVICDKTFDSPFVWGNVSTLRARLVLQRDIKSYILDTYMPTILFVVMSWGSFLVKPDVVPGRMVLLVTNLLSLVTLFEAYRSTAPPSLTVKAVEVWLISCIVFVFLALLEYAVILYGMLQTDTNRTSRLKLFVPVHTSALHIENKGNVIKKLKTKLDISNFCLYQRFKRSSLTSSCCPLDRASMIIFPILFAIYNIFYWTIFICKRIAKLQTINECENS